MDRIKEEDIKPVPRWRFTFRNSLFMGAFLLAVLLGALAFSIILFAIQQVDFNLTQHLSHSPLELFLGLLPLIWITLLITALLLGMYGIRYSKKGYKFTAARQLGYSAALSVLLGTLFFITGGAQWLDHSFETHISLYESINEKKIQIWMRPGEGQLAGHIEQIEDRDIIRLVDFSGKTWRIFYDRKTFIPPVVLLEKGEYIKIVGTMMNDNQFQAAEIRPWQGPGRRGQWEGRKLRE